MTTESNGPEGTVTTPVGSIHFKGKRMAELIAILSLCALMLLAYILWEHRAEAKSNNAGLTAAIQSMVQAQREQNCLMSLPPEKREREYFSENSFCKRISR